MLKTIELISNIFTIVASGIAIYLFIFKRHTITTIFKILLNYSFQTTLSELKAKLDRLNDLNANEPSHIEEITNIFNDIVGQMRGNNKLKKDCLEILEKLSMFAEFPKKLTEPKKRSLVSELREHLRHIDVKNVDELLGG